MKELDEYELEQKDKDEGIIYDWQKTSLKEPFEYFQKKFLVPLMNSVRKSQRDERERKAAVVGDF